MSEGYPCWQNKFKSQQNNIRAMRLGRCSNVIFLTFNSKLPAGIAFLVACIQSIKTQTQTEDLFSNFEQVTSVNTEIDRK